jgi:hypothetical protein
VRTNCCQFEPGDVRIVMLDGQPIHGQRQEYRLRVCGSHGGKARHSIEAARQRLAESADSVACQLIKLAFDEKEAAEIRMRATLQLLDRWSTRAELRLAIVAWIERTCHRRRRQRALGRLTPIEFELLHTPAATAA